MADLEPLIMRLAAENPEFRTLQEEHVRYEVELRELNSRGFLTADQQGRVSELKKLKLMGKDRMESMIRHARDTAHTVGPVPLVYVGRKARLHHGALRDLAPSVLDLMGLPQPAEMSGRSLVEFA